MKKLLSIESLFTVSLFVLIVCFGITLVPTNSVIHECQKNVGPQIPIGTLYEPEPEVQKTELCGYRSVKIKSSIENIVMPAYLISMALLLLSGIIVLKRLIVKLITKLKKP